MVELKIKKNGPELFSFRLHLPDGSVKVVRFRKDGTSTRPLADAGLYLLDWAIRGKEGTKFSYRVEVDGRIVEELKEAEVSGAQWEGGYISFTLAS
jgi:hypothetical protein